MRTSFLWILILSAVVSCTRSSTPPPPPPVFTEDWVTPKIPLLEKVLAEFKGKPDIHYLEVGVFEGRSAFWMLDNILTDKSSTATLVDPFQSDEFRPYESTFLNNLKGRQDRRKITVEKGYSSEILRRLPLNHYNIIYIDGSHAAKDVFIDAALSWGLLKDNGILIFDDYRLFQDYLPIDLRPEMPLAAFLTAFSEDLDLVYRDWELIVRKRHRPYMSKKYSHVGKCLFMWNNDVHHSPHPNFGLDESRLTKLKKILVSKKIGEVTSVTEENIRELGLTECLPEPAPILSKPQDTK